MDRVRYNQVQEELKRAGVSAYGRLKNESKNVVYILHDDEHIKAVVYGRHTDGSAMLIATEKRVIFFDKKPLFQTVDELSYDVISGVKLAQAGVLSTLTLHTKAGDYTLRYANIKSATIFKKYLEEKLIEHPQRTVKNGFGSKPTVKNTFTLPEAAFSFLQANKVAVLSTLDRAGNLNGAAIYYHAPKNDRVYILTKASTQKARDALAHPGVALTIFNQDTMQTLQLQGFVEVETDLQKQKSVFAQIIKNHQHGREDKLPIFQVEGDDFIVLKITLSSAKFSDYGKS